MISQDSPMGLSTKLLAYLPDKNNGFFIEAGANDGISQSNTLFLESERDWHGLLIEPNKFKALQCQQNRPHPKNIFSNCALVDFEYELDYVRGYFSGVEYEDGLMGQAIEGNPAFDERDVRWQPYEPVSVPAKTLTSILDAHHIRDIDFFSLDVEGFELNVLNGLDFEKHRPRLICIECWGKNPDHRNHQLFIEINKKLKDNRYSLLEQLTQGDFLFQDTTSHE
jgi:FkbM family methyltransferase